MAKINLQFKQAQLAKCCVVDVLFSFASLVPLSCNILILNFPHFFFIYERINRHTWKINRPQHFVQCTATLNDQLTVYTEHIRYDVSNALSKTESV